eukprot:COSAG02_NODE_35067_length_474_cov_0.901333_1_plen_41_part_10
MAKNKAKKDDKKVESNETQAPTRPSIDKVGLLLLYLETISA